MLLSISALFMYLEMNWTESVPDSCNKSIQHRLYSKDTELYCIVRQWEKVDNIGNSKVFPFVYFPLFKRIKWSLRCLWSPPHLFHWCHVDIMEWMMSSPEHTHSTCSHLVPLATKPQQFPPHTFHKMCSVKGLMHTKKTKANQKEWCTSYICHRGCDGQQ